GGLLTQNFAHPDGFNVGNIGVFERDEFSMIPEVGLTLGYNVTPRLKVTGGYSLLYWSNVVRPGDQIDLDVNANLLRRDGVPDPDTIVRDDHPRFVFRQTDLWAQGLNFGAEYTW
ncbi:MAG: BBP7 family outer membrane beta-barrel protein, partial [Bythopirellula sp.]